jgi:hypothetical protein
MFENILTVFDRLNILEKSNLSLGCAHIGGKFAYAISCVSSTAACPTLPPSVAYAFHLRDRRISIHIAALCARYYVRLTSTAIVCKSVPHWCKRDSPKYTSPAVLKFAPIVVGAFHLGRGSIACDFRRFVNRIDAWLHFLLSKVRNIVSTVIEECTSIVLASIGVVVYEK